MSEFSRSTGFISSNTGNQALSNIPSPCLLAGVSVITGANTCNVIIYDGNNTAAKALYTMYVAANSENSREPHLPIRADSGLWLEIAGGNGSNVAVKYC